MKILFNGGLWGREALCYQGREIIKQLIKYHKVSIDAPKTEGYWGKFYNNFEGPEDVYVMNGHVLHLPELAKKHKKIISIFQFEAELPDDWVKALDIPEVTQIWVTSEFVKKLIIDSGIKKPIQVIYLGIDKRFYKKEGNMFPKDKTFRFLNICAPHCLGKKDRKGLDVLIGAFKEEFGDQKWVTLILKINTIYADLYNKRLGQSFNLNNYLKNLIPKEYNAGNIAILDQYLSTSQINELYNSVHCGVFPSRAEGFGLPQAEMASLGVPTIFTNYSAPIEFGDLRLSIRVNRLESLDYNIYPYENKLFADPDVESLKKLMRDMYKKYIEKKKMAEEYSKSGIFSKFNWDKIGENLNNYLKDGIRNK